MSRNNMMKINMIQYHVGLTSIKKSYMIESVFWDNDMIVNTKEEGKLTMKNATKLVQM